MNTDGHEWRWEEEGLVIVIRAVTSWDRRTLREGVQIRVYSCSFVVRPLLFAAALRFAIDGVSRVAVRSWICGPLGLGCRQVPTCSSNDHRRGNVKWKLGYASWR